MRSNRAARQVEHAQLAAEIISGGESSTIIPRNDSTVASSSSPARPRFPRCQRFRRPSLKQVRSHVRQTYAKFRSPLIKDRRAGRLLPPILGGRNERYTYRSQTSIATNEHESHALFKRALGFVSSSIPTTPAFPKHRHTMLSRSERKTLSVDYAKGPQKYRVTALSPNYREIATSGG